MTLYARIQDGTVAEIIEVTDGPTLEERYHPDIVAQCVTLKGAQVQNVTPGYTYDGSSFTAPVAPEPPAAAEPTKAELLAELQALMAKIAALPDDAA